MPRISFFIQRWIQFSQLVTFGPWHIWFGYFLCMYSHFPFWSMKADSAIIQTSLLSVGFQWVRKLYQTREAAKTLERPRLFPSTWASQPGRCADPLLRPSLVLFPSTIIAIWGLLMPLFDKTATFFPCIVLLSREAVFTKGQFFWQLFQFRNFFPFHSSIVYGYALLNVTVIKSIVFIYIFRSMAVP